MGAQASVEAFSCRPEYSNVVSAPEREREGGYRIRGVLTASRGTVRLISRAASCTGWAALARTGRTAEPEAERYGGLFGVEAVGPARRL